MIEIRIPLNLEMLEKLYSSYHCAALLSTAPELKGHYESLKDALRPHLGAQLAEIIEKDIDAYNESLKARRSTGPLFLKVPVRACDLDLLRLSLQSPKVDWITLQYDAKAVAGREWSAETFKTDFSDDQCVKFDDIFAPSLEKLVAQLHAHLYEPTDTPE